VTVEHGRGITVAETSDAAFSEALVLLLMRSESTLGEVVAARGVLEIALGPLAARRGEPLDWEEMEHALSLFGEAVSGGEWKEAHKAHLEFHVGLLGAVHQPALNLMLRPLQQIIMLSSLPPSVDDRDLWDVDSHKPILDALKRGDEERTRSALIDHFRFVDDSRYAEAYSLPFREALTIDEVLAEVRGSPSRRGSRSGAPLSSVAQTDAI
jgi:DNA-binding FadR family transcriptional regulator